MRESIKAKEGDIRAHSSKVLLIPSLYEFPTETLVQRTATEISQLL